MSKKNKRIRKELNPNDFDDYGDYMKAKNDRGKKEPEGVAEDEN